MSPVYLNPSPPSTIPFLDIKENHHQLLVNQNSNNHDHLMTNLQHVEGLSIDYFSNPPSRLDKDEAQHQLKFKLQLQGGESSNSDGVVPLLPGHGHQGKINTSNDVASVDHNHSNLYGSVPALSSPLDIHSSRGSSTSPDQDENNKLAFETISQSSFSHPPPPPNNTTKWKPSKARMMQKMMMNTTTTTTTNNNRPIVRIRHRHRLQQQDINNSNVRQCSDCHTTTTPLWRSGPQGPKTLCNACGIRQRKARQAMAAAAAAAAASDAGSGSSSTTIGINSPQTQGSLKANNINVNKLFTIKQHKADHKSGSSSSDHHNNKSSSNSHHHHHHLLPYKKRGKQIINNNNHTKKLSFEDFLLSLSNSLGSTANRVFPQDEEEAAILLMALSCGLA